MGKREKYTFVSTYLNEYKEIEIIGEGGNSTVYKVVDSNGNEFALKLLNKKHDKESIKRFKNEMDYCLKNSHSNIIKVVDNGIFNIGDECFMFYVMPLYKKSLRKMIDEGIPHELILDYFNMILEAIKYFHRGNNFHRDIKPENILYDDIENKLVVSDFGISHFCKEDLYTMVETKSSSRMANFQYASPEQRVKGGIVDSKSDIYALGLILNEMFTHQVPNGSSYKKISDVNLDYSFLDEIVDNMIKQNKEDRIKDIETIQYEIKVKLELFNKNKEINKLKEIKILESEEKDILIIDPPKLIDVTFDEYESRLRFKLSQPINAIWVDSITSSSWSSIWGYDIDRFRFENEYASVPISINNLDSAQKIIDNFKQWIDNANRAYPSRIRAKREMEKRQKEQEIRNEILRKEKIAKATSGFKF
ncbi:MAG: serine/threonine protein kinase [Clostridia bacterium]|nr:serine/threonine protein kinase [Clostridia bacterium]